MTERDGAPELPGLQVGAKLGVGAGTAVYRATRDGVDYAVKVLAGTRGVREVGEFRREAALLACLDHPGLVTIHEVGVTATGRPYLVMDLVEGRSLADLLHDAATGEGLPQDRVVALAIDVAQALTAAHRIGIVHRDVKPANIMVMPDGRARLIDFGLASRMRTVRDETDVAVGTFTYAAPEQTGMLRRPVDGRADLYGLGVVLFECLTGTTPFQARDVGELIRMHLSAAPPDLRTLRPEVAPALAGLVAMLLAKDPDDRYSSGAGLCADLARLASGAADFVVGTADQPGTGWDTTLVGRERETSELVRRWQQAASGHGGAVLVQGPSGSGKSRLVRELTSLAAADGSCVVLRGTCPPEGGVPMGVLREIVDRYALGVGRRVRAGATEIVDALRAALGDDAAPLRSFAPTLADLLGVPSVAEEFEQDHLAGAIAGLLVSVAGVEGSAILHLDDIHLADRGTRRVLHRLASLLDASPLLVVGTARDTVDATTGGKLGGGKLGGGKLGSGGGEAGLGGEAGAGDEAGGSGEVGGEFGNAVDLRIDVSALEEHAVAALVSVQLGAGTVPPDVTARMAHRAAGNPLAVVEYVRAVIDAGLIRPCWGTWILDEAGLEALALPDDVVQLALRRIDGLPVEARGLLTVAGVVGTSFRAELVAAVAAVDTVRVSEAVAVAVRHRLVEAAGAGAYRFVHQRIREALLAGVRGDVRAGLHRSVAEHMQAAGVADTDVYEVAWHYLHGLAGVPTEPTTGPATAELGTAGPGTAEPGTAEPATVGPGTLRSAGFGPVVVGPVVAATAAAGALALRQGAPRDALDFLTKGAALASDGGLPLDASYHADLGLAASRAGEYDLAQRHLRAALDGEREPFRRARLYGLIADAHHLRWEGDEAIEALREGLREVGHRLPRNPLLLVASSLLVFFWGALLGRMPQRWRLAGEAEAQRCRMAFALLDACAQGAALALRMSLVLAAHPRALHLVHRLPPGREQVMSLVGFGMNATGAGRIRHAERLFANAMVEAGKIDDPRLIAEARLMEGIAADVIRSTHGTTGRTLAVNLRTHGRWLDAADYLAGIKCVLEVLLLRGHLAEAAEWFRRCADTAPDSKRTLGIHMRAIEARAAALAGRDGEADLLVAEIRNSLAGVDLDRPRQVYLATAALQVAVESRHDAAFEAVVHDFEQLGVRPSSVFSCDRVYWVFQAFGRLEQAHRAVAAAHREATGATTSGATTPEAGMDEVAARLTLTDRAVRDLGRAANGPVLRAYHEVARAALESIRGDHRGAIRRLGALCGRSAGLDMPLLDFEIALVRARACARLGFHADSRRQADIARVLAETYGWHGRVRWIRTEFGGDTATHSHASRSWRTMITGSTSIDPHERRMAALYEVSLAAATVLDADELTRVVLDEIVRIFGAERAFLFLVEADTLVPYRGRTADNADLGELVGYGSTLVERVYHSGTPLVVTGSEQGAALGSQSARVHGLRSIMVAPLSVRGGTLGVVYLDSRAARGIFTPDDVDLLAAITNHVGLALETARAATLERAVVAAERERDTAQVLHEAMAELTAALDPDEVARRLLAVLERVLPQGRALLLRRRHAGGKLSLIGVPDSDEVPVHERDDPILPALLAATATIRGEGGVDGVPLPVYLGAQTRAWLAVPLDTRTEERGLLLVGSDMRPYTAAEAEIVTALTRQYQAALDNAVLFRQLEDLATRDGLTGIFNRRHFFDLARQHVALSRRLQRPFATAMIDIDHFKAVNDTYGHGAGDEVIRAVAGRLAGVMRSSDVLCRYGGEEFAVLLPHTDTEQAGHAATRLHAAVCQQPVSTVVGDLSVTVSVGVAASSDQLDADLNVLLTQADEALYEAKRAGRNRVATYGAS